MGFLRKATFLGTGGASGVVFKANSKKERTLNAIEKQNKLIQEQIGLQQQLNQASDVGTSDADQKAQPHQSIREQWAVTAKPESSLVAKRNAKRRK